MEYFNKLEPAELERLALLSEELGEAQQAIGKILRHGYASHHPDRPSDSNRADLTREIGDIYGAVAIMIEYGDVKRDEVLEAKHNKMGKVYKYMHHNKGALP